MKITAISDIHGDLIYIEPTDLLLIAGDWSPLDYQTKASLMQWWIKDSLIPWFKNLPAKKIVFIAGNHDFICDPNFLYFSLGMNYPQIDFNKDILMPLLRKEVLTNKVKYLCNSSTKVSGIKIYGCPYVEGCRGWAFSQADIKQAYSSIPKCDILLTHQPPQFSSICKTQVNDREYDLGSYSLMEMIKKKKPHYLFCGHIHAGDHKRNIYIHPDGTHTEMYNCSIKNEEYQVAYDPQIVDLLN